MKDRVEILFRFFDEAMEHVRHLESQRSQFASVLVAVSGGVVAFGFSEGKMHAQFYPGVLLAAIGIFGALLSWKQNEQIKYHRQIAILHRKLIAQEAEIVGEDLENLRLKEEDANGRRYCYISIFPIGLFWSLLYLSIFGFGAFLIFCAACPC